MSDNVESTSVDPDTNQKQPKTDEKKSFGKSLVKLLCKMMSDLLWVICILYSLLSVVHNANQPKIRAPPKPRPFFTTNSRVRDYYLGNVYKAFEDAVHYENAFLMIYSPWDRESQEARRVLERVAAYFDQTDIMIGAVNCWYPTSDCAKGFGSKNGGAEFPFFMFTNNMGLSGIRYRGPVQVDHMIRFIDRARYPVINLQSINHLQQELQVEYSSVLLAYLPSTSTLELDVNHIAIIQASLLILERLPESGLVVCTVTNELLGKQLHLNIHQSVRLLTWNTTSVYPNRTVESERLVNWIIEHYEASTSWLSMSGRKSLYLLRILDGTYSPVKIDSIHTDNEESAESDNSMETNIYSQLLEEDRGHNVLLVFTPRADLIPGRIDPVLLAIRQITAEYYSCDNGQHRLHELAQKLAAHRAYLAKQTCSRRTSSTTSQWVSGSAYSTQWVSGSAYSNRCQLRSWTQESHPPEACSKPGPDVTCQSNSSRCEDRLKISLSLRPKDLRVQMLLAEAAAEKYNAGILESDLHKLRSHGSCGSSSSSSGVHSSSQELVDVTGLGCTRNRSLSIHPVDARQFHSFLSSLGLQNSQLPLPVILNVKEENVIIPSSDLINRLGGDGVERIEPLLREFIHSWHHHQHQLLNNKPGFRSVNRQSFVRYTNDEVSSESHSDIKEISADSFDDEVLNSSKDVVLLYTSRFCTHCTVASYAFHSVKLYLTHLDTVKFVMIDGTKNDLNWEFTALSLPSLVFFPQSRSDMSRVFPTSLELNTTNLLNFVVSNLSSISRLRLALLHCQANCRSKVRQSARWTVKELSGRMYRGWSQPRAVLSSIISKLFYAKQVLSMLSETVNNETLLNSQPQMPSHYSNAIIEKFLTTSSSSL